MEIKQDKFNPITSKPITVLGKGSDVKLDMQLDFNNKEVNIGAAIIGKVVDSNNNPIQGAIVKLTDGEFNPLSSAMTDLNGNYSINLLPFSSVYNMIATAQGKLLSQVDPFVLTTSETKTIDFTLQADTTSTLGAISGFLQDINSQSISGAIVLLYSIVNGSNTLISITYTDNAGIFVFSELEPRNYNITINALGYLHSELNATTKSGIITTLSKVLYVNPEAPNGVVSGIITDTLNAPVSNADVILYSIDSNNELTPLAFTKTNLSGIYSFINVPEGEYLVKSNQSEVITVNDTTTSTNNTITSINNTDTNITTLPTTSITSTNNSVGLAGNEFTFLGLNDVTINTLKFDVTTKKIIVKSTGNQAHNGLGTKLYFGVSLYDFNNNLKSSVFLLGKDTGNNFASLLKGISFEYGYYLKVFHYEPSRLLLSGSVCGATSDLSKGFINTDNLNSVRFYIQPNGIQYTLIKDSTEYKPTSEIVTSVNSNEGKFFNTTLTLNGNFIGAIGDAGGYAIVPLSVSSSGMYNLEIEYLCGDNDRLLQADINGRNIGNPLIASKTNDWTLISTKKLNIIVNLNDGINNIKLFNAPNTPGPWVGNLKITKIKTLVNYMFNATDGVLTNTSTILNDTFIGYIGDTGGYVTFSVDIKTAGPYNLAIEYISGEANRNFRIAINDEDSGTLYYVNKTSSWEISSAETLNVILNLNEGINNIKFYNTVNSPGPWIGKLIISNPKPITYEMSSASLNSGASVDSGGYVINNGGPTNGYSMLDVNVPTSGIYTLDVNYKNSNSEKPLNIDINGSNVGNSFTLPVNPGGGIFTTTVELSSGRNRIKFYGEKSTNFSGLYAPDLKSFSLTNSEVITSYKAMIHSSDYAMNKAELFNGATLDNENFVISQGGPSKGYSMLTVLVPYEGRYNLVLTHRNGEVRPLNVDINKVHTGTTYHVLPGNKRKFIIYDIVFNRGTNTIKFYGDNSNNYTPDLLNTTVLFVSSSLPNPSISYNISTAMLGNGSFIDNFGYSASNGGNTNGYTLFKVKVLKSGIYKLSINYRHYHNERSFKIDINSINTGKGYTAPYGDPGVFTTEVNLTLGINEIKFYGDDSINYTPDLGNLTLTLITPIDISPDKYLVPNASTIPSIYQLRNTDMKYGMFIHFGINTFVDQEWTDGSIHPSSYAPTSLEIDKWVELAWEAGMSYIISITKHHDGFSVRDSVYSDYDALSSKNSLNVTKMLADACEKYGIKLGLYYSIWDRNWDTRYGFNNTEVYADYMINQLTELLGGNYGDIVELWLDGSWVKDAPVWQLDRVYDMVKRLQPGCQVSTNWTIGGTSYIYPKYYKDGDPIVYFPSEFRLADPHLPNPNYDPKLYSYNKELYYLPFETTVCLKSTWFYNSRNDFEGPRQSSQMIKSMYTQLVNQNNNLILNAAPNKEGKQHQDDIDTLYTAANLLGIARGKALTIDILGENLALNQTVTASEEPYGAEYSASKAVDGDSNTRWATNDGTDSKWIEINLGQSVSFNRVVINEATQSGMGMRINKYKLEYWNGSSFVVLSEGTTIGNNFTVSFKEISSSKIKLTCSSNKYGPTINEIGIYNIIKGKNLLPEKVRVEYRNEAGYPVQTSEVLYGNIGDSYTTKAKDLSKLGYSFKEVKGSTTGKFTNEEIIVTYIYKDLYGVQHYSNNYKVKNGTLNGTSLQLNDTFVGAIGDAGGHATITVTPLATGSYYADIKYLSGDKDRTLKLAVNGTPTNTTYTAKKTTDWTENNVSTLRVTISLNAGINTIKFYNDNNEPAPWISIVRLTLIP
ncbi:alpha-L-fucosidase [Clostridium tarantellae]|uniref:alpha-L-fucosidase n=1 Tax=Clostridium tarantellae TaxID=39493 RepID=A0A6I1MQ79_9CLOT|nr:alpha-L-fucosidase [Clostridium tarantellae]MPQ44297.1 hypothetical protein [Clostridium tarantellae]